MACFEHPPDSPPPSFPDLSFSPAAPTRKALKQMKADAPLPDEEVIAQLQPHAEEIAARENEEASAPVILNGLGARQAWLGLAPRVQRPGAAAGAQGGEASSPGGCARRRCSWRASFQTLRLEGLG